MFFLRTQAIPALFDTPFQINQYGIEASSNNPIIISLGNGDSLVAYSDYSNKNYGQVLDSSGLKLGPAFSISSQTIAVLNSSNFLTVTLGSSYSMSVCVWGGGIYYVSGQLFDVYGNKQGSSFVIYQSECIFNTCPSLATLGADSVVVIWTTSGSWSGNPNSFINGAIINTNSVINSFQVTSSA